MQIRGSFPQKMFTVLLKRVILATLLFYVLAFTNDGLCYEKECLIKGKSSGRPRTSNEMVLNGGRNHFPKRNVCFSHFIIILLSLRSSYKFCVLI